MDILAYCSMLEWVRWELKVIEQQDFCVYFFIIWDIVCYVVLVGYYYVGWGSGANFIVVYCLWIIDVDFMELGLYFECFINLYCILFLDFDIDFFWDEWDDVMDYIFKCYGWDYMALLVIYFMFKGCFIVCELGKVYGLLKVEIDKIVVVFFELEEYYELVGKIVYYGCKLEGFFNYLLIYVGGIVILEELIYYQIVL